MDWDAAIKSARNQLGEASVGFMTDNGMRLVAGEIQAEIAQDCDCVPATYKFTYTSCRVATTANITLSGAQTIDVVAVVAGDRVLVKSQTLPSANGIYVAAAGAWARATDLDAASDLYRDLFVGITEGSVNIETVWEMTLVGALGTGAMTWTQVSASRRWEVPLPEDFAKPAFVKCDGYPVDQEFEMPNLSTWPSGRTDTFYLSGGMIGLSPCPTTVTVFELGYFKRTPEYAFRVWHDASSACTAASYRVSTNGIVFHLEGDLPSGTTAFTFTSGNTVAGLVALINGHGVDNVGLRAVINDTVRKDTPAANIATTYCDAEDIYTYDKAIYAMMNVEIPVVAQGLLKQGIIDTMKFRNGEYTVSQFAKSNYMMGKKAFRGQWFKRNVSVNFPTLNGSGMNRRATLIVGGAFLFDP
jgi:hypothetical protein